MVEDIARIIPMAVEVGGIYNICDDTNPSIRELERLISFQLGIPLPPIIPVICSKWLARVGDLMYGKAPLDSDRLEKLTSTLTFSNALIKSKLGFIPSNVLEKFEIE